MYLVLRSRGSLEVIRAVRTGIREERPISRTRRTGLWLLGHPHDTSPSNLPVAAIFTLDASSPFPLRAGRDGFCLRETVMVRCRDWRFTLPTPQLHAF